FLTEWIADALVVIQAAIQTLHICGWKKFQKILLEVWTDDVSTSLRKARTVKLLEKWRQPGRNNGIEYHLSATRQNFVDRCSIIRVIYRKVILAHDGAAVGRSHFAQLLVHRVRPDIIGRRAVEFLRPGFLHQPRNQRFHLLRRHRASTKN